MRPGPLRLLVAAVLVATCGSDPAGSQLPTVSVPELSVPSDTAPIDRGDVAPSFTVDLLDGGELDLNELRGRPVIVNFWLTTCEPCVREMPALDGAMDDRGDTGLVVVGINYAETPDTIKAFLDELDTAIDFPIGLDDSGDIVAAYDVAALPTTFFVDRGGLIRYRRIGEVTPEHLEVGLERIAN